MIREPALELSLMPFVVGYIVMLGGTQKKSRAGRSRYSPVLENQVLAKAISLVASASSSTLDNENFILSV